MSDDNIYDVENYEDVNNIGDDNLNSTLTDNINEDFIDEDKILERNNKFDSNQYNMNNYNKKKKKNGGFKIIAIALIAGLLGGALGGGSIYYAMRGANTKQQSTAITPNPQTFETVEGALTASEAFEKVAPAVVIVSANGVTDYSGIIPQQVDGMGSGFIINEEGYILTNYHVIEGAKEVVVTLSDGRDVKAKVVNYDQNQDIAMLKLSDNNVKVPAVVQLGDSDALKPGEEVLAIGTPLSKDFNQTVTGGLVSAVNRTVETSTGVKLNLIQTDAAINPGNSGGPLINTKGEVVGINTLKMSGGAEGIGFSIPINEVKDRIDALSKPILNLGVSIREVDEKLAKQYDMQEGLYIVEVSEFSPAEKAGLKGGDIIVKFDGERIKTFDELRAIRDTKKEGDIVKVEVVRNGENKTFDVQLEAKE
ncbi:S1C family serine protease [Clostridium tertium]|jgi:serine protease Do|uniref:S1C family serine protease n=1 Tax=Clostridium tertium TaxID=1559 RepID=UPI001C1E1A65|nr:trypsin-like peptidase domain-containing protein [Clostridium tertium]MBS6501910.1 trypsin-like peptidase domain-containing protein [Clostridium sp.]MBU6137168.1 trypsin-like peptidase domain-containing protein [Clostridium tertium]MDB1939882.1 trypsin-like peptidase domain-containing protein [Clostridium tertium]